MSPISISASPPDIDMACPPLPRRGVEATSFMVGAIVGLVLLALDKEAKEAADGGGGRAPTVRGSDAFALPERGIRTITSIMFRSTATAALRYMTLDPSSCKTQPPPTVPTRRPTSRHRFNNPCPVDVVPGGAMSAMNATSDVCIKLYVTPCSGSTTNTSAGSETSV